MATQRRTTVWVDAGGRTTAHLLTTSDTAAAVESALAAKSNAAVQASWEGDLTVVPAPSPPGATYADVADYALLLYRTAGGDIVKVALPAPQASIFQADGETVDPAQITAITAAVIAHVVTQAGDAITAYVGGTRQRR